MNRFTNDIKWCLQNKYGENRVENIRINKVEVKNNLAVSRNPYYVEGELLVSNPAKTELVPFKYSSGLINVDLSKFTFTKAQFDLVQEYLVQFCKETTISIGYYYIHFTFVELSMRYAIFAFLGFCMGAFIMG